MVEVVAEDTPVGLRDIPLAVADLVDSHEEFQEVEFTGEVEDVGMVAMLKVDTIMEDIITEAIRYYYRGYAPNGALFGFFLGGVAIGGVYSPFWWPYYAVPVPPAYYDPYYQYPYPAPPYVIEVPPTEATTAYPQGPPPEQQHRHQTSVMRLNWMPAEI